MKLFFPLIFLMVIVAASCGKKEPAAPEPIQASPASETAAAPDSPAANPVNREAPGPARPTKSSTTAKTAPSAVAPAAPAVENNDALVGAVHAFMTVQLRKFIEEKGRLPKDFSEFASARMDSVPRPPEGLKYVIDANLQQVKVVKK